MKRFLLSLMAFLPLQFSFAQADLKLLEKKAILRFGGGSLSPSAKFASAGAGSLFVQNGFQINGGFSYGIYRNFGLGLHLDYNQYGFNLGAFSAQQGNSAISRLSSFNSTRFGLSGLVFLPIRLGRNVAISFYAEGQAGLRGMNVPKLDLQYSELENNFTRVSYRPRASTMGYLAISGGFKLLFSRNFGIYAAWQKTMDSRHSVKYSSRAFDANDQLTEGEHFLHQYLGSSGIQGGILFVLGS
jgi:hypothetical protein